MRKLILILCTIFTLNGCQLLPDPNALQPKGNSLTNSSMDLVINTNEEYSYQGQFPYEKFNKYSDASGGTVHVGNMAIYKNSNTHSFIAVHKRTCNHRCIFSTTSNVEADESPSSFWVSGRKIFKRNEKINLAANSNIIKLLELETDSVNAENIFNISSYTSALGNSYFEVFVATPVGQPMIKVKDVVTLSEML